MSNEELAGLIAKRFIQNRATKAIQFSNGDYVPDYKMKDTLPEFGGSPETSRHGLGFRGRDILAHLEKRETYGHYLLDAHSYARIFAFDIDLKDIDPAEKPVAFYCKQPTFPKIDPNITNQEFDAATQVFGPVNPQALWHDRTQVDARNWYKMQMMNLVHQFTKAILELGLQSAAAYSGNKGVHVYGFLPEPMPGDEARAAALLALEMVGNWEVLRGKNFYHHKNYDPVHGYPSFTLEVFPKQTNVSQNGGLGNLLRLPLGRNQKSNDPTFFLDLKAPVSVMRPHPNPIELLTVGNPYV